MTLDGPATAPVALVTGATGAVGSATARRLVVSGWRVGLVARDRERVDALAAELGPDASGFVADAKVPATVEAAFREAGEVLGPPQALVHAVGSTLLKPAHALSDGELGDVLAVNLLSAVYALRSLVRAAPRHSPASVVLFSSAATRIGLINHEAIAAARAGSTAWPPRLQPPTRPAGSGSPLDVPASPDAATGFVCNNR